MITRTNLRYSIDEPFTWIVNSFTDGWSWVRRQGIRHSQAATDNWKDVFGSEADVILDAFCAELKHPRGIETTDWPQESLSDLVHHLIDAHHNYLAKELPRLLRLSMRHAHHVDQYQPIHERFVHIANGLFDHLIHEEKFVFPLCLAVDQVRFGSPLPPGKRLRGFLHDMHGDHDTSLNSFQDLLKSIGAETFVTQDATAKHLLSALREGLNEVITDLEQHFSEESEVLLPGVSHLIDVFETRRNHSHHGSP